MLFDFQTRTHGKWILCGEHAVLRGSPAIVFPVNEKFLQLQYLASEQDLNAEFKGDFPDDIHLLFWSVLEEGLHLTNHKLQNLTGHFIIENSVPVGAGMGGSAALCTAIAKWFAWKQFIENHEVYEFARQLENLFHNESSGLDIAGALAETGMVFTREGRQETLLQSWQPNWYLSHSNQVGITSHCVKKVKDLFVERPELAKSIDADMQESVKTALSALKEPINTGLHKLAQAINQAHNCFQRWGLASGKVEQHINLLLEMGALAAKPTGSGDGGYILSLWPQDINPDTQISSIRL